MGVELRWDRRAVEIESALTRVGDSRIRYYDYKDVLQVGEKRLVNNEWMWFWKDVPVNQG